MSEDSYMYGATPEGEPFAKAIKELRATSKLLSQGDWAPVEQALSDVEVELARATNKFGPFKSPLEGQAIIAEEFDEFTLAVRHEGLVRAREEAVQLAAMAIRFLVDTK